MWAWKSVSCWMNLEKNLDEVTTLFVSFFGTLNSKDRSLIRICLDDWTAYRYRWAVTKIRRIPPSLDMDFLLVELFLKSSRMSEPSRHFFTYKRRSDTFRWFSSLNDHFCCVCFLVSGRTTAGFKAHHPGYDTSVWLGVWIFGNWLGHFEACLVLLVVWYVHGSLFFLVLYTYLPGNCLECIIYWYNVYFYTCKRRVYNIYIFLIYTKNRLIDWVYAALI